MTAPAFIGRGYDQIAFVVPDLDEAQQTFSGMFGLGPWSVWYDMADGQVNRTYYGEAEDFRFSCAYSYAGDTLVELCHHDGGRSVYKDWLDSRGGGIHHIGFRVEGPDEFAEAAANFEKEGVPLAMGGERVPGNRYAYFDTVDRIGCFTEIYYVAPYILEIFARMKRGEVVERTSTSR